LLSAALTPKLREGDAKHWRLPLTIGKNFLFLVYFCSVPFCISTKGNEGSKEYTARESREKGAEKLRPRFIRVNSRDSRGK